MANRYWVGGTAAWNGTAGTKWALTSGGAGGQAVPTSADDVFFSNLSTGTCTISTGNTGAKSINCTGFTGTIAGTAAITVSGSITLVTGMGFTYTGTLTVNDTGTLTTASKTLGPVTINGAGITVSLGDSLTMGATATFTFTAGTLNLANNTLSAGLFASNNSNTRVIQFGTGNIAVTGSGASLFNATGTNLTYTGTPTVNINNNSATASTVTSSSFSQTNALDFNITTGTYTLTIGAFGQLGSLNFTGFAGTVVNSSRLLYRSWTNPASGITWNAGTSTTTFSNTFGTQTITTNNVTLDFPMAYSSGSSGGTLKLVGSLRLGATRNFLHASGTFDADNNNVTVGSFSSSGATVRTILMGSGTWTLAGTSTVWDTSTSTNLTLTPSTSTIVLSNTSTSARTFAGGGLTYNNLTIGGTTGISTLTFSGSNTFNTLSSTKTVAHTILFTASTTNTFTTFNINGTSGNVVTIGSVTAASHTLAKAGGGTVTADYLSISRSTATPTLTWLATNSTDGGNNSGWYFGAFPSADNSNFFLMFA
jgi:hypothetical protein